MEDQWVCGLTMDKKIHWSVSGKTFSGKNNSIQACINHKHPKSFKINQRIWMILYDLKFHWLGLPKINDVYQLILKDWGSRDHGDTITRTHRVLHKFRCDRLWIMWPLMLLLNKIYAKHDACAQHRADFNGGRCRCKQRAHGLSNS